MFNRHFSPSTIKALAAKGIVVTGIQATPAFPGDVYHTGTAYLLNDNGTGKVRSFMEVLELAK